MCPSKITDKNQCESKGFTWIPNPLYELPEMLRGPDTTPGSCYKGRYAYLNNKPGYTIGQIDDMNGLIPSLKYDPTGETKTTKVYSDTALTPIAGAVPQTIGLTYRLPLPYGGM